MEVVRAVGHEEFLQGMGIVSIILTKFPAILLSKWTDYSYALITDNNQKPRLVIMADFVHEEAVNVSTTSSIYFTSLRTDQNKQRNRERSRKEERALRPPQTRAENLNAGEQTRHPT